MASDRRAFLGLAAIAPLAALSARAAWGAEPPVCYDPAALPLSQKSRRRALGYADVSADPKRNCGTCAFFTGTQSGCGTCQLLTGGPVMATGLCNSHAPKPG